MKNLKKFKIANLLPYVILIVMILGVIYMAVVPANAHSIKEIIQQDFKIQK